jgi:hypothetical protein
MSKYCLVRIPDLSIVSNRKYAVAFYEQFKPSAALDMKYKKLFTTEQQIDKTLLTAML